MLSRSRTVAAPGAPGTAAVWLAVVPMLTVAVVLSRHADAYLGGDPLTVAVAVAAAWLATSPFTPLSVPDLVLQSARDAAVPVGGRGVGRRGVERLVRPALLLLWLTCSPRSGVRAEMATSLAGSVGWRAPLLPGLRGRNTTPARSGVAMSGQARSRRHDPRRSARHGPRSPASAGRGCQREAARIRCRQERVAADTFSRS